MWMRSDYLFMEVPVTIRRNVSYWILFGMVTGTSIIYGRIL